MNHQLKTGNKKLHFTEYIQKFNELQTVFDALPDGIVAILDSHKRIATANRAIARMLGIDITDLIGKEIAEVVEARIPGLSEVVEQTLQTGQGVSNYTTESVSPDGVLSSFLVSTALIQEVDQNEKGVVLILHDVSEVSRLRKIALQMQRYGEIVGNSDKMKNIYALIESIKEYDTSVLIVGETGTGKELVARALHQTSRRKNKPFVPVNCSALPENLIESELFGHVKGAFTGAIASRPGRFHVADGGTLFLDEVGTLPLNVQVKLLRAIQERKVEPVGSSEAKPFDVRIISATNRDLFELVAEGKFREDLLFRLKVMRIDLPPLRERGEDVLLLAEHFISKLNRYYNKNLIGLAPTAREKLLAYQWPGNVRELENAIEHAFVLATGVMIEEQHLPPEIRFATPQGIPPAPTHEEQSEIEEDIRRALLAAQGNVSRAAEMLNMHRTSLWRKMREFHIEKGFGKVKK
ncbi:MAG: sigma-54 dependent transcriptional regulator [Calditrichia bacterium]